MFVKVGLVVLGVILTRVEAQTHEGGECTTPDSKPGTCIDIKTCPVLVNMIRSNNRDARVIRFLQESTCGFKGSQPLVCCQRQQTTTERVTERQTERTTESSEGSAKYKLPKWPLCGLRNESREDGKIVGGRPAGLGEFPWIVALGYRNTNNPDDAKWLCGGSLITEKHVLTAGHCLRPDLYIVRAGDLDLYDDNDGTRPENIPIKRAIRHEGYNAQLHTNDVAVLVLSYPAKGYLIAPVCLPVEEPLRSRSFDGYTPQVAGWGSVYFRGPSSPILQVAQVPVIPLSQCASSYASIRGATIDDRILCAAQYDGHQDSCEGDSGGPLIVAYRQGSHLQMNQIGIVSYGHKCAEPGYPGVYTRVTKFIDWIEKNLVD